MKVQRALLINCLRLLLKPLVRFCLKHALRLHDLIECAKLEFIECAKEELESYGEKANTSRVSVMTGVHRRDVVRLKDGGDESGYVKDVVNKILGFWQTNKRYTTSHGVPRILPVSGGGASFTTLVHAISQDLNPGTVLFELERVKAVERTNTGIKLLMGSYVPVGNVSAGFQILSNDISDLSSAVEKNVVQLKSPPHFHARTEFDNIRADAVADLERWFLKEGHQFHLRAREFLGQYDQDVNPDPKYTGKKVRAVVSGFSFIDEEKEK